jgi:hypothetical protein
MAKLLGFSIASAVIWGFASAQQTRALTAELAKKCQELSLKAHPPARPGTKSRSAEAERAYFADCIKGAATWINGPKAQPIIKEQPTRSEPLASQRAGALVKATGCSRFAR